MVWLYCLPALHCLLLLQEPYRFVAVRGSEALIEEAGAQLHEFAVVSHAMCVV